MSQHTHTEKHTLKQNGRKAERQIRWPGKMAGASPIVVRALTPADSAEATAIWAEAMLSYDKVFVRTFVEEKLASDMADVHASYVATAEVDGSSGFWVATDGDVIVGCVGVIRRSKEELKGGIPPGKEYLNRVTDKDGVPMAAGTHDGPLWGPLGVDGTSAAAELVRMAVHSAHRGRGVARALVRRVAEYARDAGCDWVVLTTAIEMPAAVATYEHLGFQSVRYTKVMAFGGRPADLLREKEEK